MYSMHLHFYIFFLLTIYFSFSQSTIISIKQLVWCILTVQPPPSVVMSQNTRLLTPLLRYIVYTPSLFRLYGSLFSISVQSLNFWLGSISNHHDYKKKKENQKHLFHPLTPLFKRNSKSKETNVDTYFII